MNPARKYVLDTQLYVRAFRDAAAKNELELFHHGFAPFEYFSVIVGQELRAGAGRKPNQDALARDLFALYERRGRSFAPSAAAWHRSGEVLAAMARREGLELGRTSKSFSNDVLLALSCREVGCVLITDNVRDFRRIRRYVEFEFVPPWPAIPE